MLKDKVALITGSTSGIGAGIAEKLASHGANIVITGLVSDRKELNHFLDKLRSFGNKADFIESDLTQPKACTNLIDASYELHKRIDILINNAGMQHVAPIEEFPQDKWDLVLELNLTAPFKLCQKVLPYMRKQNFGRIINVASAHGLVASVHKSAYVASKHALVGLTKVIALETAQDNITANAICPGWVLTPLVQKQIDHIASEQGLSTENAKIKLLSQKQPSERFVTPHQVGAFVVFLSSDDACEITGTTHSIDGGWTAQ